VLNARSGSLAADFGTTETAAAHRIADMIGCPGRAVNRRSANDGFWDVASIAPIDAKQSLQTSATGASKSYRCWYGTSALPSEAESRSSSALGRCCCRTPAAGASGVPPTIFEARPASSLPLGSFEQRQFRYLDATFTQRHAYATSIVVASGGLAVSFASRLRF
jgi:hypothetical protein